MTLKDGSMSRSTEFRARFRVFINEVVDFTGETHALLQDTCEVTFGRAMWDTPGRSMSEDELIAACADVDAVMGSSRDRYTRRLLESCPRLQIVSKYGTGVDRIDVVAATELGILVGHTPIVEGSESVAEHAVALTLALLRRIPSTQQHLLEGGWRGPDTGIETLRGKTVGLIGFGRIGRAVSRLFSALGTKVISYDPYVDTSEAAQLGVDFLPMDELLAASHVVSVHVIATDGTYKLLDEHAFARMPTGGYVVNTSRGTVIDQRALYEALDSKHLAGAALDVFDPEPPDRSNPLLHLPNVIVTPHVAGFAGVIQIARAATNNTLAALSGDLPPYLRNPGAVQRWRERRKRLQVG